jgi:hypothetical protein
MNAILLVVPILFLRYGILGMISKEALKRANFFGLFFRKKDGALIILERNI